MGDSFVLLLAALVVGLLLYPRIGLSPVAVWAGTVQQEEEITYIVHVSKAHKPATFATHEEWYTTALAMVRGTDGLAQEHLPLYFFDHVFHGFAAKLSSAHVESLQELHGFLSAFPDSPASLHTTHTPEFVQLRASSGLWPFSEYGEDVIIGVLDTGVWPERASFNDEGLGPVPFRWKGTCSSDNSSSSANPIVCNRKLIGARSFYKGYEATGGPMNMTAEDTSPRDIQGHGTHTASTAAGNYAYNASLLGYAHGTARGMAPRARIAAYKVCWLAGCFNSDILAAFDAAVADGVDIISLSVGENAVPYYLDAIAIGSFGAVEKGILVSCSAGNAGPSSLSVTNVAPWIFTVAASSVDRDFPAPVMLGNGAIYPGVSLYSGDSLGDQLLPLIYAGDAGIEGADTAAMCTPDSLNPDRVAGKIVICDRGITARAAKGMVVKQAGGVGMIVADSVENGEELPADSHVLPANIVGYKEGMATKAYAARGRNPTAKILFKGTTLDVKPAPMVTSFSSRGPNPLDLGILKPDITAPGVGILAAWTGAIGPTGLPSDTRVAEFNILSGTSMSCPHVSGLAALLKAAHPRWSPAAIKSAFMTTATLTDNTGGKIRDASTMGASTPFCHGAGHVNPEAAMQPGLVYDIGIQEYVDFLCGLNYTEVMLKVFTKGIYECSKARGGEGNKIAATGRSLNYPSISDVYKQGGGSGGGFATGSSSSHSSEQVRTLTNVGPAMATYTVSVVEPDGVKVSVEPRVVKFSRRYEKQSFRIYMEARGSNLPPGGMKSSFGSLTWVRDGGVGRQNQRPISVTSPIVFTWIDLT